jgi:hypothetical protein
MSSFAVDTWYGSAASVVIVSAIEGVDRDSISIEAVKAAVEGSLRKKAGRAIYADCGVRVLLSYSSSISSVIRLISFSEGSYTSSRSKHIFIEPYFRLLYLSLIYAP